MPKHNSEYLQQVASRRTFLQQTGVGLGSVALSTLLFQEGVLGSGAPSGQGGLQLPHHQPKVKRVIFLCMAGGPSHLETFDHKPKLTQLNGEPMPASVTAGQPIAQLQGQDLRVLGPIRKFGQYGENGQTISEFLPWHQKIADDICILKSVVTEQINHDPAHTFMNTGTAISGRPSMGAWVNYGLGCETSSLPGFIVLTSVGGRNPQPIASRQWGAGFLPSRFQGVEFNSTGAPVHYVESPSGVPGHLQHEVVQAVKRLDHLRYGQVGNPELLARIAAYETAFRMQSSVPELIDVSDEPQHILDLYGAQPGDGSYASNCLLARRLAERGVRFIHLYHRGWDHHGGIDKYMTQCCGLTDQPTYALITDLKQRGMLDDTLVVWGGEFGRTPMFQKKGEQGGRDHHIAGFSMWVAGGGIRGGISVGSTDELGYHAVENRINIRDLHATMLHLLGLDHHRFSLKFQGLDMKLTGVEEARVVREALI
ncbi:MAG TPA: sulfatase [Planctomycetaceae bacterium]|nr:sulfatase [Planctomycetaceae bacterium]